MTHIYSQVEGELVTNTVEGQADFRAVAAYITQHIDEWTGKSVLWDICRTELQDVTDEELQGFTTAIAELTEKRKGEKTAILASPDRHYGLMKVLQVFAETAAFQLQLRTFRTQEAALAWLSTDDES